MKHTFSADDHQFRSERSSLEYLSAGFTRSQRLILKRALSHYWVLRERPSLYPNVLHVAAQLKDMRADVPILVSALFGSEVAEAEFPIEFVREHFGQECAALTAGVRWLNQLILHEAASDPNRGSRDQAETLRRMVLSMVQDIRVVLVKLAFRTQRLYLLARRNDETSASVAQETLAIYAPLANRLGLGQLKWELEDVAFRIVEPVAYKRIASALEENRLAREAYIDHFVEVLDERISLHGIRDAQVFGRPKHIYSIWKKMRAKQLEFTDLFDVRAVRVLVGDVQQCYSVLGIAHSHWQPITREFDDYIANPKDNGYQSLHTAVIGPAGKPVEVQIRTRLMNQDAETGVAAHWAYKEGSPVDVSLQKNINTLKQLLDEGGDDEQLVEGFSQQLDAERVYVFTPQGEVIDLVTGSTPLDFAYHIHSEIGHRCRGARVNGSIVQLTRVLQNGDQVEILTTREAAPSRDWLNQSLGYVKGSRARGKIRAWFNTRDHDQHLADGRAMVDRELKRLKATSVSIDTLTKRLKFDKQADLFVAIGRNEVTMNQVVGAIDHLSESTAPVYSAAQTQSSLSSGKSVHQEREPDDIQVRGVGNLLTQVASCCQPVPHDDIVGFITRGKGVSIHRADCSNMLNLPEAEQERLIEVDWGSNKANRYRVEMRIIAYDRQGLLRDVSTTISAQDSQVVSLNTRTDPDEQIAEMTVSLNIGELGELATLMDRIRQLRNVQSVERVV